MGHAAVVVEPKAGAGVAVEPGSSDSAPQYVCPMHAQIVRGAPGACPICGMALELRVPTAEDEPNAELVAMKRRQIDALKSIEAKTLVIGISSDILFPVSEQQFLAAHIPDASLNVIDSKYGHDGFLLEFIEIKNSILNFLEKNTITGGMTTLKN